MKKKDSPKKECPQFPYFGAGYPDAICIDGVLHDLDDCDDNGSLYVQDEDLPCPFCRPKEFIMRHTGYPIENTRKKLKEYIEWLNEKYGTPNKEQNAQVSDTTMMPKD